MRWPNRFTASLAPRSAASRPSSTPARPRLPAFSTKFRSPRSVDDRGTATQQLAQQRGATPARELDRSRQQTRDRLAELSGAALDRAYVLSATVAKKRYSRAGRPGRGRRRRPAARSRSAGVSTSRSPDLPTSRPPDLPASGICCSPRRPAFFGCAPHFAAGRPPALGTRRIGSGAGGGPPAVLSSVRRPRRLAWPRTPDFQSGNTGSNPVGDIPAQTAGTAAARIGSSRPWPESR